MKPFPLPSFSFLALACILLIGGPARASDTDALNTLLAVEHEAIVAYQIGADTGLLKQPALNMALLFQSHHKTHRDAVIAAIEKANGTPVNVRPTEDYVKELNASALKTQNDVLELLTRMELAATNAYIEAVFEDRDLHSMAGRVVADDAMHWTALVSTLQKPLPANALSFGPQQNP